jgi:1-acyl-sn-glycerol-3-phosphate acyltransferase
MLKRGYYIGAYAASWVVFGLGSFVLTLPCAVVFVALGRARARPLVRAVIRWFFSRWIDWLRVAGLVRVTWHGLEPVAGRPAVCVANHPGLLDAVFLLARLPDAVCVFKRAMLRNPFLAPAAVLGGHPVCDTGPDFVRAAVRQIARGCSLLIFPEGTRTAADATLNPLLPGFALIAARAGAPVQVIVIRSSRDLLPRGRPWWHVPRFPATVDIRADAWLPAPNGQARETTAKVEERLRACLA